MKETKVSFPQYLLWIIRMRLDHKIVLKHYACLSWYVMDITEK
jgi:hypothetical protein